MITHYDLFAGIGGFSVAIDEVFYDEPIRHIFCEWESFPTQVLKKHWPDGEYWGDIAELVAYTSSSGTRLEKQSASGQGRENSNTSQSKVVRQGNGTANAKRTKSSITIVTGGFPCQPFSAAGRRRGTSDDRYKWPEMFEVIRNVQPDWVIAENVRGLVTWNEGMVLQQVCTDLEAEGYEVQPLIIPAVAVNAPHRRDRVWIIANRGRIGQAEQKQQTAGREQQNSDVKNSISQRGRGRSKGSGQVLERQSTKAQDPGPSWQSNWLEVATELCGVDDGLPAELDGFKLSKAGHRKERLKSLGNAIVPQVAIEIMKGIKGAN